MVFEEINEFMHTPADSPEFSQDPGLFQPAPGYAAAVPIDVNGDSAADGWGYDLNGDHQLDVVYYDLDHDHICEAVGYDTTGNGIINQIHYDFDHDGIEDATAYDDGSGIINKLVFADGTTISSDIGFSISSGWEAGFAHFSAPNSDAGSILPGQAARLGLDSDEQNWAERAMEQEKITPETARKQVSFGATCLTGTVGCTGCAGILADKKIGCHTGSCSGGTVIK